MKSPARTHQALLAWVAFACGCASVLGLPDEYTGEGGGTTSDAGDASIEPDAGSGGHAGTGGTGDASNDPESDDAVGGDAGSGGDSGAAGSAGSAGAGGSGGAPTGSVRGIAAGAQTACAIVATGTTTQVYCWGNCVGNLLTHPCPSGQTVVDEPKRIITPSLSPVEDVKSLAAGWASSCALKNDGTVWCWGNCAAGALGNPDCETGNSGYALQVQAEAGGPLTDIEVLGGGGDTYCGATSSGQLYCWGVDVESPSTSHDAAVAGPQLPGVTRIDASGLHLCALANGNVTCWGANNARQSSGIPLDGAATVGPTQIPLDGLAIDVATGYGYSCAVLGSNKVICWGAWEDGTPAPQPQTIGMNGQALSEMQSIASMYWHSCALSTLGEPYCWGQHAELWLGPPHTADAAPVAVLEANAGGAPLAGMQYISGKGLYACAASSSKVYCWGDLSYHPPEYACQQPDAGPETGCAPEAKQIIGLP